MPGLTVEKIDEYLGKPVNDPYGRRVGYIVGFYSDSDGNISSLEVSFNDFDFKQIEIERFRFENGNIILLPEWEYMAIVLENRLERVKKRAAALEELNSRKEIPKHTYEEFKKKLEESLIKLKEDSKNVKEVLRRRMHEIEDMIVELEKAVTAVKVSYIGGEIPEKAYKASMDHLRRNLDILNSEKASVKNHLDRIEALENLPVDTAVKVSVVAETPSKSQQPIPVVVVES
ncbi:MAG: CdvA-like protein [Desulfurococcus sp.]|jgi:chromosome segregation ATPase|uniref:CdvA-like protein n=1 Tax=Desulfurococcus sp. TaxID=51678 RepID=UPI00315FDA3E